MVNVKNLFFILIFLCIAQPVYPMGWAGQFVRNAFKRNSFAQPTSLAYLYAMRTYERKLDDDTVQQLQVGSDIHKKAPNWRDDFQQIWDVCDHMREQPSGNCFVAVENQSTRGPSYFLGALSDILREDKVAGVNLEFRDKSVPGWFFSRNKTSVEEMLVNFERYAHTFKDDALGRGILTAKDFEHLIQLRKDLAPHLHKTMYNVWRECGYNGFTFNSISTTYMSRNTLVEKINKVASSLIEDAALYHTCTNTKPAVYLHMGGGHIERKNMEICSIQDDLDTRLKRQNWRLIKYTGVGSDQVISDYAKSKKIPAAINVAQHFASLPPRGSTLPPVATPKTHYQFTEFMCE